MKVFKKSSPNGKITVYLGKRDFIDHLTHTDPIDGVVVIDDSYVTDHKIMGQVIFNFHKILRFLLTKKNINFL